MQGPHYTSYLDNKKSRSVFCLIDVNNMYVSCERLFRPDLDHIPMVVLSNNDGCVVARSPEVRKMGVPMGIPWFQIKDLAKTNHIQPFSSNYPLYADMSNRFISLLSQFSPEVESYSIDECFLNLYGIENTSLTSLGKSIKTRMHNELGLPVAVGIGLTKTLAKLANHIAKTDPIWNGVLDLTTLDLDHLHEICNGIDVAKTWGIGSRLASSLRANGIQNVHDLMHLNPLLVRKRWNITLERTIWELQGLPCQKLELVGPPKKEIISSRMFGAHIIDITLLKEAMTVYVSRASAKLRKQKGLASGVKVFLHTNQYKLDQPQYARSITMPLVVPTNNSVTLVQAAHTGLDKIFSSGFEYIKTGVVLTEIVSENSTVQNLQFPCDEPTERNGLMHMLDQVNGKWGSHTLDIGVAGINSNRVWSMKQSNKSPGYTTNWNELKTVYT